MHKFVFAILFFGLSEIVFSATLTITPTTTLTAETSNNTSGAPTFTGQPNGNHPAGNASKVQTQALLYPGSTTKIYAHFMPWFGSSNHVDVGYRSDDPTQVRRQLDDMQSRGIHGVVIDWYGPRSFENNATILVMQEAQYRTGFEFAIMEDVGALKYCLWTPGCDLTDQVISDLSYVYVTFQPSPRYMRLNGRPVVFFFGLEKYPQLDWNRIRASVPGNPIFISRNTVAYNYVGSNGAFAWIEPPTLAAMPSPTYMGLDYFDFFYKIAQQYPQMLTYGSVYKGFNDTISSWSVDRHIAQNCGQTWLATFAEIGMFYSSSHQLPAMQLVTWNDYEEGTALETGIDNCLSISASALGNKLSWSISGAENTVNHYTVFISKDGQNLMPLTNLSPGTRTLDLSSYSLTQGQYVFHVKAVGKPSIINHMSNGVTVNLGAVSAVTIQAVTIQSPKNGATVTSPVRVIASAVSTKPIVAMQIYTADYVLAYQVNSSRIDTYLRLSPNTYKLVVQAWDSAGAYYKSTVNINVATTSTHTATGGVSSTGGTKLW